MRKCGSCTACCHYLGIKEIGVTPCPHEKCSSCEIYDKRPKTCRDYNCLWLQGFGDEVDRPDKSGVLIDMRPVEGAGMLVCVNELEENSFKGRLKQLIYGMTKTQIVFIKFKNNAMTGFYHPKDMKEQVLAARQWLQGVQHGNHVHG